MCLVDINNKAALNVTQRTATDVLIDRLVQHSVDQTFAQRTACQGHTLDIEFSKNGDQNGEPTGENQRAFERQPFYFKLFQTTTLDGALFKLLEFGKRDPLVHSLCHHDFLQRLNGSGRADTHFPAVIAQFVHDRAQDRTRRVFRLVKILFGKVSIGKVSFQPGHTAHRQAEQ